MSALGAAAKVSGTNKNSLLRINNRHSMFDANLNRSLLAYQREYIFTVAGIDFEKKELKTFLKRLYRCESDNDPFARKYLRGNHRHPGAATKLSTLPEIEEVLRAQFSRLSGSGEVKGQSAMEKLPPLAAELRGEVRDDRERANVGQDNKSSPEKTSRCLTSNVCEAPHMGSVLAVLPNRHNCARSRVNKQVRNFCDKMESFKSEQREQGHITQIPSVF